MKSIIGFTVLLLGTACSLPPVDPFVGAESAIKSRQFLAALKHLEAVPINDPRYHDARVVASQVEQRIRHSHELVLEALRLRAEWRDIEALRILHRARQEWPGQPDLDQWISVTKKRLELFGYGTPKAFLPTEQEVMPADSSEVVAGGLKPPLAPQDNSRGDLAALRYIDRDSEEKRPIDVPPLVSPEAVEVEVDLPPIASTNPTSLPEQVPAEEAFASPVTPVTSVDPSTDSTAMPDEQPQASIDSDEPDPASSKAGVAPASVGIAPTSESDVAIAPVHAATPDVEEKPAASAICETERPPLSDDPVALGLVSVEARIGLGEFDQAVFDLVGLLQRFPKDRRLNRRVVGLLHQRALMHYGRGKIAAAIADWQFLLEMDPENRAVEKMVRRAANESAQANKSR